ncbi:serine/arginine-rich splicing factor 10 isoform X1 [Hydra vulgaris]|uniref:Serine/arginine-rich splicing factor 10 isoform X3 n=1 Tax=Hydra vulgaris TaxID=6087 RepID=A0ABM4BJ01_HYDVU|nr:serine/arginine-rich splicing factor 10 isoform X1 [Hydra vulgaris]
MSRRGGRTPTSVFVRNVHHDVRPEDLRRVFEKYGDISDVYVPLDYYTRESRGFAYIQFDYEDDAEDAVDGLDGTTLFGRQIFCKNARGGRKTPHQMRYKEGPYRRKSYSRSRSRSRSPKRRHRRSPSRSRSPERRSKAKRSRSRSPRRRSFSKSPIRESKRSRTRSKSRSRSKSKSYSRSPR